MFVSCKQTVEMLKHNKIAPFTFLRSLSRYVFSFTYRQGSTLFLAPILY